MRKHGPLPFLYTPHFCYICAFKQVMITIVNYGMGNLGSIANMLRRIGADSIITSDPDKIAQATKLILPGVGAFDTGMDTLDNLGITTILNNKVQVEKIPVLGICLGMQLMTDGSDEGQRTGLGWVKGRFEKFSFGPDMKMYKVPHMGWNKVEQAKASKLLEGYEETPRFYFVHSYYFKPGNPADVLGTTSYGINYASAFEHENIVGVQFHPEKSHKYGMNLLKNFAEKY